MRKGILVLACVTSIASCQYQNAGSAMITKPISLMERLNVARVEAIDLINLHLSTHPNCDLSLINLKDKVLLEIDFKDPNVEATVFTQDTKRIFFGRQIKWTTKKMIITMIHESFHITKQDDKFICGEDYSKRMVKGVVCRLLGEVQYTSDDINQVIEKHLEKELKGFK